MLETGTPHCSYHSSRWLHSKSWMSRQWSTRASIEAKSERGHSGQTNCKNVSVLSMTKSGFAACLLREEADAGGATGAVPFRRAGVADTGAPAAEGAGVGAERGGLPKTAAAAEEDNRPLIVIAAWRVMCSGCFANPYFSRMNTLFLILVTIKEREKIRSEMARRISHNSASALSRSSAMTRSSCRFNMISILNCSFKIRHSRSVASASIPIQIEKVRKKKKSFFLIDAKERETLLGRITLTPLLVMVVIARMCLSLYGRWMMQQRRVRRSLFMLISCVVYRERRRRRG